MEGKPGRGSLSSYSGMITRSSGKSSGKPQIVPGEKSNGWLAQSTAGIVALIDVVDDHVPVVRLLQRSPSAALVIDAIFLHASIDDSKHSHSISSKGQKSQHSCRCKPHCRLDPYSWNRMGRVCLSLWLAPRSRFHPPPSPRSVSKGRIDDGLPKRRPWRPFDIKMARKADGRAKERAPRRRGEFDL